MDFSDADAKVNPLDQPEAGIFSRDGKWKLLLIEEKDTNGDGVIDWQDLSSLYLARTASSEMKLIDLVLPVGSCTWGVESLNVACSLGSNGVIYLVDLESGELLRQLSDSTKTSWSPRWSPDGNKIAFLTGTRTENGLETEGIWVVDVQTGELVYEIAESSVNEPVWSPSGARIAFVASLTSGEYSNTTIEGMYRDVFYIDIDYR